MSKAEAFLSLIESEDLPKKGIYTINQIKKMTDKELLSLYKDYVTNRGVFTGGHLNNGTAKDGVISGSEKDVFDHFIHPGSNLLHNMPRYDQPWHMPKMQTWDKG